jgi:hypothetical protein
MHSQSREARAARTLNAVRAQFLDHLGDDATPDRVVMADKAARHVVKVAALKHKQANGLLTMEEANSLAYGERMLDTLTRRLGIAWAPRRADRACGEAEPETDGPPARLTAGPWG